MELEQYVEVQQTVEVHRKRVVDRITLESERLIDELLLIIYNNERDDEGRPIVDAKVKLSAISMLLDRGIPKLGVEHISKDVLEESDSKKRLREEIESLVRAEVQKG